MELFKVDSLEESLKKLKYHCGRELPVEHVQILQSLNRVLAENIVASENIPPFSRATVDGYAVNSADVFGASESIPSFLEIVGQVEMGKPTDICINRGAAAYVPTGGMLPENADAMVMIEYIERMGDQIAVYSPSAPGDGIIAQGEDTKKGETLFLAGHKLRPQDIGALAALGIEKAPVRAKPKVAIFSTGDEIVDPFSDVKFGQIRDINSFALAALVEQSGATVGIRKIISDNFSDLKHALESAMQDHDILILSGGSSMGNKDMTKQVIDSLGKPGVLTHGLSIKPGKPTIIGAIDGRPVFGLPGHPVSSIMVYYSIVHPFIESLLGIPAQMPRAITAILDQNIRSDAGKVTYQMVTLYDGKDGKTHAAPVYGKSGAISLITKANAYFILDVNCEGIVAGENIDAYLF